MQNVQTPLPVGTIIHRRYRVEDQLDKSSSGAIYLVKDQRNKQKLFVLKEMIPPSKKGEHRLPLQSVLLKRLDHPALPHVYDVFNDEIQGRAYIVMNYIEGSNLEILQQQQPGRRFSLPRIMSIMAPIVDAVTYLHSQHPPIIHGNIKPVNIIVPKGVGGAMLVDLGSAKEYDTNTSITLARRSTSSYGAPEQYSSGTSPRTDIYALGATLYTLLTGTVPADALYRLAQLNEKKPDPLMPVNRIAPGVPIAVAKTVHRAMSISSHYRFSTVEQFWRALNGCSKAQQLPLLQVTAKDYKVFKTFPVQQQVFAPVIPSVPPLVIPKQALARPATVSVPKQPGAPHARKHRVLLPILLALLVSLSLGTLLLSYIAGTYKPVSTTPTTAQHQATSPSSARPTGVSTPNPSVNIVASYNGTIHNIPLDLTTNMSLTRMQQSQRNIRGYFAGSQANGLQVNEPFSGIIDAHGHIHFTVAEYAGQVILSFNGTVQADGTLAGSYCNLGQNGQCAGEYGLWSAAPGS